MPLQLFKYVSPYYWMIYVLESAQNKKELLSIASVLTRSGIPLRFEYKLRIAAILLNLRRDLKKKFGMFVIFGWDEKYRDKYIDVPDATQDIFRKRRFNIFDKSEESITRLFRKTVNFDGAILIDAEGDVLDSGVILEGLHPKLAAQRLYSKKTGDLSSRFGFVKKVHTRHLNAIAASYELRDTTVFTVSEETGDFHIFEKGKIVYSTVKKEIGE
jgi:DNA integrity scanning protein DisA with diadenylate cyclase activity